MDRYTKAILTIIAIGTVLIAVKLYIPSAPAYEPPNRGEFFTLRRIKDPEQRRAAITNFLARLPLVWVQGGDIDATVSGTVGIDR